jgi:hypothetical protein
MLNGNILSGYLTNNYWKDFYSILGVSKNADAKDLKKFIENLLSDGLQIKIKMILKKHKLIFRKYQKLILSFQIQRNLL